MNPVAELARVPNPQKNLKSGDFSYERFTTSQHSYPSAARVRCTSGLSPPPLPLRLNTLVARNLSRQAGETCA